MSASAIVMMLFGLLVTWGGAAVCIALALKKRNLQVSQGQQQEERGEK